MTKDLETEILLAASRQWEEAPEDLTLVILGEQYYIKKTQGYWPSPSEALKSLQGERPEEGRPEK